MPLQFYSMWFDGSIMNVLRVPTHKITDCIVEYQLDAGFCICLEWLPSHSNETRFNVFSHSQRMTGADGMYLRIARIKQLVCRS